AQSEIARLEELRSLALEERIGADLACGAGAELVGELEALVSEHPFRERLREQLMLALCRAGRQADALAAYRAARETFVEELGVEPGPDLRALEQRILNQDVLLFGLPQVAAGPRRQQRKLVTVLFADVADSTALSTTLDPETVRSALDRYFALAAGVVAEHGGTVEKFIGDAVMA